MTRWILLVGLSVVALGCSTDREQQVLGKWQGDALSATFAAVKLKEDSGASTADAKNAAKLMAATSVELRKDKTFTGVMGGATLTGTWTIDKEKGEVVMKGAKLTGPDGQEVPGTAVPTWTGILSESNDKLSFYPMNPEGVAMVRTANIKGGLTQGISLYKK